MTNSAPAYFLGQVPFVSNNIAVIMIGIVVVSFAAIGVELLRSRRRRRTEVEPH